jgi:protein-disulfide isomerase
MRAVALALAASVIMLASDQPSIEGNSASAVRVIVYEDLACSDCAIFRQMLDGKILPRFGQNAAFEHRDFPLPKHPWARQAAMAARFFDSIKPGLGIEWRRYALVHLNDITPENVMEKLAAWSRQHGTDGARAVASLEDKSLRDAVERDYREGIARGVAHTPTVLVDGEPFIETFTYEEIAAALERAASSHK